MTAQAAYRSASTFAFVWHLHYNSLCRQPDATPSHIDALSLSPPSAPCSTLQPRVRLQLIAICPLHCPPISNPFASHHHRPSAPLSRLNSGCHSPPPVPLHRLPALSAFATHHLLPATSLLLQFRGLLTAVGHLHCHSKFTPSATHHHRPTTALPHHLRLTLTAVAPLDRPPISTTSAVHFRRPSTTLTSLLRLPFTSVGLLHRR